MLRVDEKDEGVVADLVSWGKVKCYRCGCRDGVGCGMSIVPVECIKN